MLFNYINVIPDCVPNQLIDLLIKFKNSPKSSTTVKNKGSDLISDYRITDWISLPLELIEQTNQSIGHLYYTHLIKIYNQDIKFIEGPQFLYYNVGGKYDVHNDSEDFKDNKLTRVCERDITILAYLNDDYEGGELEFPKWGVFFKPKKGTVISFPSYIEFSHRVLPVTKGERYNLAAWICTNDRIYSRPY